MKWKVSNARFFITCSDFNEIFTSHLNVISASIWTLFQSLFERYFSFYLNVNWAWVSFEFQSFKTSFFICFLFVWFSISCRLFNSISSSSWTFFFSIVHHFSFSIHSFWMSNSRLWSTTQTMIHRTLYAKLLSSWIQNLNSMRLFYLSFSISKTCSMSIRIRNRRLLKRWISESFVCEAL